jgi:hypothetical protein
MPVIAVAKIAARLMTDFTIPPVHRSVVTGSSFDVGLTSGKNSLGNMSRALFEAPRALPAIGLPLRFAAAPFA